MNNLSTSAILLVFGLLLGMPQKASAFYYDPGIGSVMTQVVFASWLAGVVAVGRFRHRIVDFFKQFDVTHR